MKKITCYDCDQSFEAQTREDILKTLYDHYMTAHKETITGASEDEKKAWMEKFDKDWEAASEVQSVCQCYNKYYWVTI